MFLRVYYIFCMLGLINSFISASDNKFCPPANTSLLIIGQDNNTINEYISKIKIIPAGFMLYTSIQDMDGLDSPSIDRGSGIFNANELNSMYPNSVLQIGLYMVGALKKTTNGEFDGNIEKLIKWLKIINIPVYLRIGYEFDGAHNGYDPEEYKNVFVYIYDKLASANIRNVAFVWHANALDVDSNIIDWFPGEKYVDWVGISYFDQSEDSMMPVIRFAKKYSKPVMIAEATPKGIGAYNQVSWEAWYKPLFKFIRKNDIRMLSYINSNWEKQPMWVNQGWEDARVQSYPFVKEHWINEISKDNFLKKSDDLYSLIEYNSKNSQSDKN